LAIELTHQNAGVVQVAVRDDMTIYTALEQKRQLFAYLTAARRLQIDLGGVTEIDGAGVQLLMFLKREALVHHIDLSLARHSRAVVEALELLNLGKYFGDPIVMAAGWKPS